MKILFTFCLLALCNVSGYAQDQENIELANVYYQNGEVDKALAIYEDLAKKHKNIPLIHQNYFKILINTGRTAEAEIYIDKVIKRFPGNINYQIDKGVIYREQNQEEKEKEYFDNLIQSISGDPFKVRIAAQHMTRNQLTEYALQTYLEGRKRADDPYLYAIQLASIYRLLNEKEKMVNEYLNYVNQHPNNLRSVKNILQNVLTEEEDLDAFESMMYDKVQKSPNNIIYVDLLIWINLQRKNFYAAFIQARALDKRKKLEGVRVMEIGRIALENKDYRNSIRIFEYIIDEYPGSTNYQISRRLVIKSREELVKTIYPVEIDEITKLIADYDQLIIEIGLNNNTIEALRSKALLHAFYLDEHEIAIGILEEIIKVPRISKSIIDQSKLDLGDIYLLIGEPWESTLLYSQVEKSSKETPKGYEAKLKNAQLSYYKGEFALAQSHLDILKMATTREIANDAMALSLLIKDNTLLDSNDIAMKRFADIDLLIFQNKKTQALNELQKMLEDYPSHSLVDEILWKAANIEMETGNFQKAIVDLQKIVDTFGSDILGDDAYYLMGKMYEEQVKDDAKAMEIYQDFLIRYPGSSFAADARKRFRYLRGDYL